VRSIALKPKKDFRGNVSKGSVHQEEKKAQGEWYLTFQKKTISKKNTQGAYEWQFYKEGAEKVRGPGRKKPRKAAGLIGAKQMPRHENPFGRGAEQPIHSAGLPEKKKRAGGQRGFTRLPGLGRKVDDGNRNAGKKREKDSGGGKLRMFLF